MKLLHAILIASSAFALSAHGLSAQATHATQVTCKDGTTSKGGRGACSGHGGIQVQVTCKDGTMSKGGRGACSSHGGILVAAAKPAAKADAKIEKTEKPAAPKARKPRAKA